jgi:hypothetical protein
LLNNVKIKDNQIFCPFVFPGAETIVQTKINLLCLRFCFWDMSGNFAMLVYRSLSVFIFYFSMLKRLMAIAVATVVMVPTVAEARTLWIKDILDDNGQMLGLGMESVKINGFNREFKYHSIGDNGVFDYKVTTPWCYKGKVQLDKRALAAAGIEPKDYPNAPGWESKDSGGYYFANSVAKLEILRNVCRINNP